LLLILPFPAHGDRIELKNGQAYEGALIEEREERIQLKLDGSGARLWFSRDQISSIETDASAEASPAPEDARGTQLAEPEDDKARARELLNQLRERSVVSGGETVLAAAPFKGEANAPVTITVFTDYQ
jgi:hypothetical protein